MAGDFLVAREVVFRDGGARTLKGTRFDGAVTPTLIGADAGHSGEHGTRMAQALNRMIRVAGHYYMLSTHRGIYHLNQSGAPWPSGKADGEWSVNNADPGVCQMSSTADVPVTHYNDVTYWHRQAHTGIHVVLIPDGSGVQVPHLCALYMDSNTTASNPAATWRAVTLPLSTPNGSWTVDGPFGAPNLEMDFNQGRGACQVSEVLWDNKIAMLGVNGDSSGTDSNAHHLLIYDPVAQSLTSINIKTTLSNTGINRDSHSPFLAVWEKKLFLIAPVSQANSIWRLYELQGSSLVNRGNLTNTGEDVSGTGTPSSTQRGRRCAAYVQGGNLYVCVIVRDGGIDRWKLTEVAPGYTFTDRTSDLPSAMRANLTGNETRVVFAADPVTSLGSETIYAYFNTSWDVANEAGSPGSLGVYQVGNPGTSWTSLGSAGDGGDALPMTGAYPSGGERIDIGANQLDFDIINIRQTTGGMKVRFRVVGGGGSTPRTVKMWHDPNQHRPTTQAPLVSNSLSVISGGPGNGTQNGDQIDNVEDDGTVEYEFIFDAFGAGYADNDKFAWTLSVE